MVLNMFEKSAFFAAYVKEKQVIDAALIKAAQEAAKKVSLKEAFTISSSELSQRKAA